MIIWNGEINSIGSYINSYSLFIIFPFIPIVEFGSPTRVKPTTEKTPLTEVNYKEDSITVGKVALELWIGLNIGVFKGIIAYLRNIILELSVFTTVSYLSIKAKKMSADPPL